MQKWYEEMSAVAQTSFANLIPAAKQFDLNRTAANLPGGFTSKKLGTKEYWYYQYKDGSGKPRQIYLGGDSKELQGLIRKFSSKSDLAAGGVHLTRLCRAAIELGIQPTERAHFKVIRRLSDHGFFHAGGVLIGTHAFLAYQNHLGVSWVQATKTQDIDFAHPGNNLSLALPDGIKMDAQSAIKSLEMGFIPNVSHTTFTKSDEPDFQLDFVVPKLGEGDEPVLVPNLNLPMQPLKFMAYSMEDTMQAVLVSATGPVVVNVPRPERYALHKLIVFGERPREMETKAKKDVMQAASLITYLNEHDPVSLQDAWAAIKENGRGWVKRCKAGADYLKKQYPEVDLSFMDDPAPARQEQPGSRLG